MEIEQITLSIDDLNEHWACLRQWACVDLMLPVAKQYDDMLERFIHTFLEDIEL